MIKTKQTTHVSGEHFTHRILWHCAQILFDKAREQEDGSFCLNLAASLFIYLAFEGFLNYIGTKAYPELWEDEKTFFSKGTDRGTLGKLDYIAKDLNLGLDKSRRPFQTIHKLDERRDQLVHARIEIVSRSVTYSGSHGFSRVDASIYSFGDPDFVKRAFQDVETTCDQLLDAVKSQYGEEAVDYSPKAFVGMHSHQSSWIG